MFLARLNRSQQEAFLNLARNLVSADNTSALGEIAKLAELRREMGISTEERTAVLSVSGAAEYFADHRSQTIVLLELINLAHSDQHYSGFESSLVRRLCAEWEIEPSQLTKLEAWVAKHHDLMAEALKLMSDT